jgi:hypothetical protein
MDKGFPFGLCAFLVPACNRFCDSPVAAAMGVADGGAADATADVAFDVAVATGVTTCNAAGDAVCGAAATSCGLRLNIRFVT